MDTIPRVAAEEVARAAARDAESVCETAPGPRQVRQSRPRVCAGVVPAAYGYNPEPAVAGREQRTASARLPAVAGTMRRAGRPWHTWGRASSGGTAAGASLMTLLERHSYLDPGDAVDVTHGYPEGLSPQWIRDYQLHPPGDFLDVPPDRYLAVIRRYFQQFFCDCLTGAGAGPPAPGVSLVPTATMAFTIAATTLMRSPGDEFVLMDTSYDSYPGLLRSLGAQVRYAHRDADGLPDMESVRAACSERTRAIVTCCPDNPLGVVSRNAMEKLITLCKQRRITLLADHCLAEVDPMRAQIPVVPRLASARGLSYVALADTGKILGLGGSKIAALAYSRNWTQPLEAAASMHFFQFSQYDLYLLATILSDSRFSPYRQGLSTQMGSNYLRLREKVQPPLTVEPLGAGCFALVDAAGLGLDDVSYARLLQEEHQVLVVPVSWFPAGARTEPQTRVRVSLARPGKLIIRLGEALNASGAASAGRLAR